MQRRAGLALSEPGVDDYVCAPHEISGMVGRIVVGKPAGAGALDFDYWRGKSGTSDWRPSKTRHERPSRACHVFSLNDACGPREWTTVADIEIPTVCHLTTKVREVDQSAACSIPEGRSRGSCNATRHPHRPEWGPYSPKISVEPGAFRRQRGSPRLMSAGDCLQAR
jgi:hypothetical protein